MKRFLNLLIQNPCPMIEFSFRGVKVCFDFSFFAAVSLLMLCSGNNCTAYSLYACLLHESGHLLAMLLTGQTVKKLVFYGAGIKIIRPMNDMLCKFRQETITLASGCTVNFILYAVTKLFGFGEDFGAVNLAIGLFNALPISFLDGGKIITAAFYRFLPYRYALKAESALNYASVITVPAAAAVLFMTGTRNFTIYLTLLFLLFTAVMV